MQKKKLDGGLGEEENAGVGPRESLGVLSHGEEECPRE